MGVDAMRAAGIAASLLTLCAVAGLPAGEVFAEPIPGLFDTGVDAGGAVLPAGSSEVHYSMTGPDPLRELIQHFG